MDWSKAKNILIAALLAADIFLGMQYFALRRSEQNARVQAAAHTKAYLESLGISLQCSLPTEEERLPVVFVNIAPSGASQQTTPDGRRLVVIGAEGLSASALSEGQNRGTIISASNAALRLLARPGMDDPAGLTVHGAALVYLVDRNGVAGESGQDTAVPAWAFDTDRGTFYIEAFGN